MIAYFLERLETKQKENKMNKFVKLIAGVFLATILTIPAFAADTAVKATDAPVAVTSTPAPASDLLFGIGGNGVTTTSGDDKSAYGLNLSLSKNVNLFTVKDEVGLRQSIGYASTDGGTTLLSTKPFVDFNVFSFNVSKTPVDVFVGGNAGLTYGNTPLRWTAAPEVGVDVWLAKNVAIEARGEYAFDLNPSARSQNAIGWFIGAKLKF